MKFFVFIPIAFISILISCSQQNSPNRKKETIIYQSTDLIVTKLSESVYEHTSFLQTETFGKVPCNGMIVTDNHEAIILDTPANVESTKELIRFISNGLNAKINSVVATHFHEDCVAGLNEFRKLNIPSYANQATIELLKNEPEKLPQTGFKDELILEAGNKKVFLEYFGEGHTKDNIIAYFPDENVMFGGCLIKEVGAGKGNLEDANEQEWPETVSRIKQKYPDVKIVIPGHGERGGKELLDYTIRLFKK